MATKVTKLRPTEEGLARIELGFSREDIEVVRAYDERALRVVEKDTTTDLFRIALGDTNAIGRKDLLIKNSSDKTNNIVVILHDVKDTVDQNVALANIVKYGNVIEKQVSKALAAYNKDKESVLVEGEAVVKEGK